MYDDLDSECSDEIDENEVDLMMRQEMMARLTLKRK